jgi:hypothetical protein
MMPGSNGATQFQTLNNMGQMQSQTTPQKLGNNNFMQNVNANNGMAQQLANFSTELGSPNLIQQQAQQQVPQSTLSNSGPTRQIARLKRNRCMSTPSSIIAFLNEDRLEIN